MVTSEDSSKKTRAGPQGNDPAETPAMRAVDWGDYRDHLATADREGRRQWIYAKQPSGRYYRARKWFSALLLLILFAGPFVRIDGNPLLLLNIVERRFSVLGQIFWPEDTVIFAVAMLLFLMGIAVFTAAFGRLWCGWACPQTLLMEMVFRRIEYWIEGDAIAQRALAAAPWGVRKLGLRLGKHGLFLGLSFLIGNTLLSYIIGMEQLFAIVTDDPRNHLHGLSFMVLFALLFYAIFARFREQACTFICPYGRFQSTLIDENTIVVAYDRKRGEPRGRWRREQAVEARRAAGSGDCIGCRQCVAVCPTGIDIRDGTQMECVNCTACIDACDTVMQRVGLPDGLIRYASLNGIERGEPLRVTPRLMGYGAILLALGVLLGALVLTRSDVETLLLRAPGGLYQTLPDGRVRNLYTMKVVNKTNREIPLALRLEGVEGQLSAFGGPLRVEPGKRLETSVLIDLAPGQLSAHSTPVRIGVYSGDRRLETVKTTFIGPQSVRP